jgi:hypothetical protein
LFELTTDQGWRAISKEDWRNRVDVGWVEEENVVVLDKGSNERDVGRQGGAHLQHIVGGLQLL